MSKKLIYLISLVLLLGMAGNASAGNIASNPSPADGAKGVPIDPILTWEPGDCATLHDVYFGVNVDDVENATTASPEFQGSQPLGNESYGPLPLVDCITYYWRIDEVCEYTIVPVPPPEQVVVEPGYTIVPVVPDPAGLLLYYSFDDDDASDSSGNNRHGTEMAGEDGTKPTYEDSKVGLGRAIRFNDDGDHVLDDDAGDYMNGLSKMTVSLWIKSDKTDRDEGFIHFGTEWNDKRSFRYDRKGASSRELKNVIKYGVSTTETEGSEEDESSGEVQTKDWQHVAMTWKSGVGMKLYIDGVLDTPGWDDEFKDGPRGGVTSGYSRLLVGKGSKDNSDDESWNGLIDEVRIYNTVLSYGQIRYLAGETTALDVPAVYGPLIAEYTFESGDADDTSGNELHGTLIGDATIIDSGDPKRGLVAYFDGDNDCIDLGNSAMFNLGEGGDGPFSISAWINVEQWIGSWGNVVVGKRGESSRGWQLRQRSGDKKMVFTTRGSGTDDPGMNIRLDLGRWYHLVVVYDRDSQTKTVYVDGELDRQVGGIHSIEYSGHNTYIGGRARKDNRIWNGVDGDFKGMIDDVRIYNYPLSYDVTYKGDIWSFKTATAYCLKIEAIAALEALLSEDSGDDDLIQAIGYLHMSLGQDDPRAGMSGSEVLWADPTHVDDWHGGYKGVDVFQYEQEACDKLDAYIENDENAGFGFGAGIEAVRQMLAEADKILAETAISDAYANTGNPADITVAEVLKTEGDAAKAKGGTEICDVALDKYEEAWEKAVGSWCK